MPSNGRSFEYLDSGKTYTYTFIKPKNANLTMKISTCSGAADVELINGDTKNLNGSYDRFQIGKDLINSKDIFKEFIRPSTVEKKFTSELTIVKVTPRNFTLDFPMQLTFGGDITTEEDPMRFEDYFGRFKSDSKNMLYYTIEKKDESFNLIMEPLRPSRGFSRKFQDIQSVDVQYIVMVAKHVSIMNNIDSECSIEAQFNVSNKVDRRDGYNYKKVNGKIQWGASEIRIDDIPYPEEEPPYTGLLQMRIAFNGPYSDGTDDDSVILIKHQFTIKEGFIQSAKKLVKILGIVMLVLAAVICYLGIKCASNQPRHSTKGAQRISTELPRLDLQDTTTNNQIETVDVQDSIPKKKDYEHSI